MKIVLRMLALVSTVIVLSSGASHATGPGNQGPGPSNLRQACGEDAQSLCKDVQPEGGRIIDCLEDHYKEVSDACYAALQNLPPMKEQHQNAEAPPPDDNNIPGDKQ